MTWRLALRSLATRPVRSAVLACGFGFGISVMAALLGVGEVILDQARSPALAGGGDLLIRGTNGSVGSARMVTSSILGSSPFRERIAAVSPSRTETLYLERDGERFPVVARGGIPSLERAVGDPETAGIAAWVDAPADAAWSAPDPGDVLRAIDRFHPIPDVPARAGSWAEWLYFNGGAGDTRFYLTFLFGPRVAEVGGPRTPAAASTSSAAPTGAAASPARTAFVRLQLDRGGIVESYSARADVPEGALLEHAPDVEIGRSRVRLEGRRYRITLDLEREGVDPTSGRYVPGLVGEITLDASAASSFPPFTVRGAAGWLTGYVVPVLSGPLGGTIRVGEERLSLDGGTGYHDHNWGFWEGVSWQWGQVAHQDLSIVYGRVHPPADAADPDRLPGFLAVLGPDGPLGFATYVKIREEDEEEDEDVEAGLSGPRRITIEARGASIKLEMRLDVARTTRTELGGGGGWAGPASRPREFLQLDATYTVEGLIGDRHVAFEARGAAETFRDRPARPAR